MTDMEQTKNRKSDHIEFLNADTGVFVSAAHTFGTDAMLLADFAAPKRKDKACDLGTGCGIIPLLWFRDKLCASVDGVELQEQAFLQFQKSIAYNHAESVLTAYHLDLIEAPAVLPNGAYDLVTMNPPYKAAGAGIKSEAAHAQIARHEIYCTLDDIAKTAFKLLKFGGRFCICIRPERLAEAMAAMERQRIEPKRLRLVAKNKDCPPWLCLLEGRSGGKRGMTVLPNLFLYEPDGTESEELRRITGAYAETSQKEGE